MNIELDRAGWTGVLVAVLGTVLVVGPFQPAGGYSVAGPLQSTLVAIGGTFGVYLGNILLARSLARSFDGRVRKFVTGIVTAAVVSTPLYLYMWLIAGYAPTSPFNPRNLLLAVAFGLFATVGNHHR